MEKVYTIKDIAKLAEVSEGTVDRVLHKRGKVSQKSLSKVMAILDEIDYVPNLIARNLKNSKIYRICVLMPDPQHDPYWIPCKEGIIDAKNKHKLFNISIDVFLFDPTSVDSFNKVNKQLTNTNPDAVLIVPFFYKESIKIISDYNTKGIVSCTFNNQLKTDDTINFVGQDLVQSGRIAARLFDMLLQEGTLAIVHIDEDYDNANYMREKETGFRDYFEKMETNKLTIKSYKLKHPGFESDLNNLFKENVEIKGIFVTTSKAHQVASIISRKNKKMSIVGSDLLEENITYLKNKSINFLINQNPKRQAYLGITLLIDHFVFGKNIPNKTLLPIDIINSENC